MNLVIDIGNTFSKYYCFDGDEMICHGKQVGHDLAFIPLTTAPEAAIVSSVVTLPPLAEAWLAALPCPVIRFSSETPIPLRNAYRTPDTLGPDRLAAAIGAWSQSPGFPLLIIDAGSCITFDFVTAEGEYVGGNISPGLHARLKAIDDYFPRLPLVEAEGATPELGYNTETAIRSGVIQGLKHEIEGYIAHFKAKYPQLLVFLTGGDEINFEDTIKSGTFADQFLVPRGLNTVLRHQMTPSTTQQ